MTPDKPGKPAPAKDPRRETGRAGEDLATAYLREQGYRIVERNWRCRMGEIDIVAKDGPVLVIVEVRSKRSAVFGSGLESVSGRKLAKLTGLAEMYLVLEKVRNVPVRLDVVSIVFDGEKPPKLEHVKNITG